jgi:hypothetical protein
LRLDADLEGIDEALVKKKIIAAVRARTVIR